MKNLKKKILFILLGSFLFACGQKSNKSKIADLLTEFLLSLAPSSFKLVKKTADFYSLELSFTEELKPELQNNLKKFGCLGDVLIFQKYNETSQTYEGLNENCRSLALNVLVINSEARDKEGKKMFSYSLSLNKNDPSYSDALKTFEASPLNPNNYDEAYQLIFDLKKLVAGTTHDVEEVNQLELTAQFQTLPKVESAADKKNTLHLLFKKHEHAKAFAEKIKLLTADKLLSCEPEATVQALDKEGQCLDEVQILATLDHPSEGKKLSLQENSGLYIHQLNFNHRQDSEATKFSISQDYLVEWNKSSTGLVTPPPAAPPVVPPVVPPAGPTSCPVGQYLSGTSCVNCPNNANCTGGSASFTCKSGYEKSGAQCVDINECAVNSGKDDCSQVCINNEGAPRTCDCNEGFTLNADGKTCDCNKGSTLNADGKTCDDTTPPDTTPPKINIFFPPPQSPQSPQSPQQP